MGEGQGSSEVNERSVEWGGVGAVITDKNKVGMYGGGRGQGWEISGM